MTYRIQKDNRQFILQQWVKGGINRQTGATGADHWKDIGYYGKLEHLAADALKNKLTLPDANIEAQLAALPGLIKEAVKELAEQLKEVIK